MEEITVKNFGDYTVKGVKTFMGTDAGGYNATLYRKGKKVAFVIEEGGGGEAFIQWIPDVREEEARLLKAHVDSLPLVPFEGHPDKPLKIDESWFVSDLVAKWEFERDVARVEKKVRKDCETKTLFRLTSNKAGEWYVIQAPCTEERKARLREKYGSTLSEIVNERFTSPSIVTT